MKIPAADLKTGMVFKLRGRTLVHIFGLSPKSEQDFHSVWVLAIELSDYLSGRINNDVVIHFHRKTIVDVEVPRMERSHEIIELTKKEAINFEAGS